MEPLARLGLLRLRLEDPLVVVGHDLDEPGQRGVPLAQRLRRQVGAGALGVLLDDPAHLGRIFAERRFEQLPSKLKCSSGGRESSNDLATPLDMSVW